MGVQENFTTTLSAKGQVLLPKAIRDQKHWSVGTKLIVEETSEGVLLKAAPIFASTDIDAVFGSLRSSRPPLSVEEMNAVLAEEASRGVRD